ncbi:MAG: NAD(P)H-hydrate dehydratase, partial [candidate division Zixibacteria bacterium]|nr:NAD(P)H-hydrate dehydratase [candidate division Zixibacteria bacterium]
MGIPGLTMMENAGRGMAERIREGILGGHCRDMKIAIVCGRGNNGGDGFVVARYLAEAGAKVAIHLLGSLASLSGDAKANAVRPQALGLTIAETDGQSQPPDFASFDLLIDAIFGTGFRGPVDGVAARYIDAMNRSRIRIVAVDSPSGLNGDSGVISDHAIRAHTTMTLAASKRGQWLWPGRACAGHLETIDIGIPDAAVAAEAVNLGLITEEYIRSALPRRPADAHKGTFGTCLLIGSSVGMSGAVALAANAAMRSGVGLAYVGVPASLADVVDAQATEPVIFPLPEVRTRRVLALRALGEIVKLCDSADAVALGPGLSTHHETQELARRLVSRRSKPMVLDADGLNACARDIAVLEEPSEVPLVITPHVGEMARLLGRDKSAIAADREAAAREASRRFHCITVMKGAPTFVADPTGMVYLNPTGNSGMASGGVGDVLTGIIVSFLAQGCSPLVAALLGVYVHGQAGDLAAAELGERSLVASDLIDCLPNVFMLVERQASCHREQPSPQPSLRGRGG